jgi:hypothetical protein
MVEQRLEVEEDEDDRNDWPNPKNDWVKFR